MKIEKQVSQPGGTQPDQSAAYLTKHQVAALLGVSVRTVDNLMRDRRLPFIKLTGKLVRFPKAELEQHIHRNFRITPRGETLCVGSTTV